MFDEYDEGTAILPAVALKRNLPSGGEFIALDADGDLSLPSDWYLKIAAFAAEVMRGQREVEKTLPRKMLLGDYWGSRKRGPAVSSIGGSGSAATYVPKVQEQVPSASVSAPTGAAASADVGFWQDIKDTKDDEPPPPAYTLESEEHPPTPSTTNAPSVATSTSQPPLSAALTAGDSSHNRVSTVPANGPTATTQAAGVGHSSSHCASQPTPTSSVPPLAPWAPPPATHRFAPPPSAPPSLAFTPPPMGLPSTPPHSPTPYNPAISSLSSDFSLMNVSTPSPPTKPENQTEFPFNRPAEVVQPQQYAHYTGPQSTHQSGHAHSGSPATGGWTAPAAPASPPPGTHSPPSQYPHHASPASQTQQWGQPSGPPPTSSGFSAYAGHPGGFSSSPYQPPSSCTGTSLQPQPANLEHGAGPSNTSVQSPWHSPQPTTSDYAGVQQNQGQNPPSDQPGTLYGGQYYPGHAGTSYAPPPGPPQPPQHPNTSGASWSGTQTQPDPNFPNKRTSHTISKRPILIRFVHCTDSSLYFACSHISLGPRFLPQLFAMD